MEKVGNYLQQSEQSKQKIVSRTNGSSPIRDRIIARFWTRMAEVYGHKWVSQYGEVSTENGDLTSAAKTWAQGLSKVSVEEIGQGFTKLLERQDGWPPSLPEFIALARQDGASYHRPAVALPPAVMSQDEVREALEGLKSAIHAKAD